MPAERSGLGGLIIVFLRPQLKSVPQIRKSPEPFPHPPLPAAIAGRRARQVKRLNGIMLLGEILTEEQIVADLSASDRWEAIDELIDCLAVCRKIRREDQDAIAAAVKKREASMSTGIGFGVGLPHASTDLVDEVVGAFGRSTNGVRFDALDNKPVHLVLLFLVPQGHFQKHLHTLANIAKMLHDGSFRNALRDAPTAADVARILQAH